MNEFIEIIKNRRSVRSYLDERLPDEILHAIIEAGRSAPSGGNNRSATFIVIQNRDIINKMNEIAAEEFADMEIQEGMYPNMVRAIKSAQNGTMNFAYDASALILFCNKKSYINAMQDCVCALENMVIASEVLGVGSCYVNQIHWLTEHEQMRQFLCELGMDQGDNVYCSLILGYARKRPEVIPEREGNRVIFHK